MRKGYIELAIIMKLFSACLNSDICEREDYQESNLKKIEFSETKSEGLMKKVEENDSSNTYLPYEEMVREVEKEPYDSVTNNCKHKALKISNFYLEKGIESRVIIAWDAEREKISEKTHALVLYKNKEDGKYYLTDPTSSTNIDGILKEKRKNWVVTHFLKAEKIDYEDLMDNAEKYIEFACEKNINLYNYLKEKQKNEKTY